MANDAKKLEEFVIRQLGKEIHEFKSDRVKVSENFTKLEQFIVHALAKEINEFAIDKRDLAETKVKLVREAKQKFGEIRKQFVKRSAKIVENVIAKRLASEIVQLKEDITNAKQNDFGRRMFEAFAQEYSGSYLNEKSETKKLLNVIRKKIKNLPKQKKSLTRKA